jgi:multicomponent Na+:H+ antiporter subunit E
VSEPKPQARLVTVVALSCWTFLGWVILTWTLTIEQMVVGAGAALLIAISLTPLGPAVGPWWFLRPRRMLPTGRLLVETAWRSLRANIQLSARIWSPRRPLSSGMIVVSTHERSGGRLAAVGLISSLVVDNQLTDLDRSTNHLQYHAVSVPEGDRRAARDAINGPIERLLTLLGGSDD